MFASNFAKCWPVFTARRYASAVYAIIVCLSHAGIVPERLKVGSCKQRRKIAQEL